MVHSGVFPTSHIGCSASWKQLYDSAILESHHTHLNERIAVARCAICDRAEEILTDPSSDESQALNHAFRALRMLEQVAARESDQQQDRTSGTEDAFLFRICRQDGS